MKRRYASVLACGLAGVLASTAAFAGPKPFGEVSTLSGEPMQRINTLGVESANATCTLGVLGAPAFFFNYLLPPNDAYYTKISSADCSACTSPGGIEVVSADIFLNFRVNCTIPVRVALVGAQGDAGCRTPDPNNLLCAPITYNLSPGAAGNFIFTMPLPAGCCVSGDAFVEITFLANGAGCSTSTTIPRLITTATCDPCTQYNIYPGGNDEWCSVVPPGNFVVTAAANCCNIVPALPKSWGQLRMMYRS